MKGTISQVPVTKTGKPQAWRLAVAKAVARKCNPLLQSYLHLRTGDKVN